jgi:D-xylose transport system permease protein
VADPDLRSGAEDQNLPDAPDAVVGVEAAPELSAAALSALPAEVYAQSLKDYFVAWARRLRNGESGALPIILGLVAVVIFFQVEESTFLTSGNLVNLFVQASIFIMFGAAELTALLLSEIDLSVGFVGAVGAFIIAEVNQSPVDLPWWVGVIAGVGFTAIFGCLQGTLISRLGLPSFVVTLGGFLAAEGIMLELASVDKTALGGVISINGASPVYKLAGDTMSSTLSWIVLAATLAAFAAFSLWRAQRRRKAGLAAPPIGVTLLTLGLTAIGGIALVAICNANTPAGVPWVVPFILLVLALFTFVLNRTRLGRYIYAIGGNPEAARRAGINVAMIKTIGFGICGLLAGFAGMTYASRLGSMSTDFDGGTYVLYAVAAAVIGGASLFGGRGRPLNALLGGLVIAVVANGLGLMGVSAAVTDIVTAIVLIAAVTLDSLVRRRATAGVR